MGDLQNDVKKRARVSVGLRLQAFYEVMWAYWTEDPLDTLARAEKRVTRRGPDNNWHHIDR
jgi:hypothetical protein